MAVQPVPNMCNEANSASFSNPGMYYELERCALEELRNLLREAVNQVFSYEDEHIFEHGPET